MVKGYLADDMATGLQLCGKLALVTGGGSGIGRAVCEVFARHGASVVAADINESGAKQTAEVLPTVSSDSQSHHAFALDVTDKDAVQGLVKKLTGLYQRPPSVLVNSAGIAKDKTLLKMPTEFFDEVIDVNLKGTFLVTQAVSQVMVQHKTTEGTIVNISSIAGKYGNIGQSHYAASKAGVIAFTKTTAKELARFGIRCNVVIPGFIKSPMTDALPEQMMDQVVQFIPLKRQGEPSEIANVCLFLASNQSSYMTGSEVEVSGGLVI